MGHPPQNPWPAGGQGGTLADGGQGHLADGSFLNPLLREIDRMKAEHPDRLIAVVVPEIIETRWWHLLLHRRKPARLRAALLKREDHRVVVVSVPWYVDA